MFCLGFASTGSSPVSNSCHGVFVFAAMVAALSATAIPGDIDGDWTISTADSALLVDHLVCRCELTSDRLSHADANEDTAIDAADLIWIMGHMGPVANVSIDLPGAVPLAMVRIPSGRFGNGIASDGKKPRGRRRTDAYGDNRLRFLHG